MQAKYVQYVGIWKYQRHKSINQQVLCSPSATYVLKEVCHSLLAFYNMLNSKMTMWGTYLQLLNTDRKGIILRGRFVLMNRTVTGTLKRSCTLKFCNCSFIWLVSSLTFFLWMGLTWNMFYYQFHSRCIFLLNVIYQNFGTNN